MSRVASAVLGLALAITGCTNPGGNQDGDPDTVRGIVLEVNGDLEAVASFVLRSDDGDVLEVVPAPDGDFRFPLPHLHDHRRTLEPVVVELDRSVDPPLATAIRDADNPTWHAGEQTAPEPTEQGDGEPEKPRGPVIELAIIDGRLDGGARRESVDLGDDVTLRVSGNSEGPIHVHGYDLFIDLVEGAGELTFKAEIPGVFEIEIEGAHTLLVRMEVS